MALLELKGFGVRLGAAQLAGIDLAIEPGTMLAVVGRGDGVVSLLALAIAGLLPRGAVTTGTLSLAGKRVLYLDRDADASAVSGEADLIVADEPGRGRDPATQLALLQALQQAARTAAVLIFTADFRLGLSMGLEVAVIAGGKLLLKAPASQIFELPQYDTVRHLVGGERVRTRTLMRPPIGEPMLELDGVARSYRRGLPRLGPPPIEALKGVGFAVRQGEVVGVLGLGGAGKTTLLRLIAGLEMPSAGHIGRRPGLVGFVFADPRKAFNPTLPVGVSLTEPLRVEQTLLVEEQADRLVEVVRAVGLEPELLTRLPGEFGTADLQRMALARALVGRPNLLLLDDPTAVLDPAETREFLVLFARVRADFGLTAIIASREFEVVRAVADRLLVLDAGHIVEGGKPAELVEAPKQEMTRRLVSVRYPGPAKFEPVATPAVVEPEVTAAVETQSEAEPDLKPAAPSTDGTPPPVIVGEDEAAATVVETAVAPVEPEATTLATPSSSAGPPPPPRGGGDDVATVELHLLPRGAGEVAAEPPEGATTPSVEPEPVHTLSAEIVIAPVVLAEPIPAAVAEIAETLAALESEAVHSEPIPAPIVVPEEVEVPPAPAELVPETETPAAAEAEPAASPERDGAPPAMPAPVTSSEPEPPPEPAVPVPSGDGADEAAESGEAQGAVGGLVDTAGSADAPDSEAGR